MNNNVRAHVAAMVSLLAIHFAVYCIGIYLNFLLLGSNHMYSSFEPSSFFSCAMFMWLINGYVILSKGIPVFWFNFIVMLLLIGVGISDINDSRTNMYLYEANDTFCIIFVPSVNFILELIARQMAPPHSNLTDFILYALTVVSVFLYLCFLNLLYERLKVKFVRLLNKE